MYDLNKLTRQEIELLIKALNEDYDHGGPNSKVLEKIEMYHMHRIKQANPPGWGGWGGSDSSWCLERVELDRSVGGGGASMGVKMELAEGEKMPETITVTVGSGTGGGSHPPKKENEGQGACVTAHDVKIKYIDEEKNK